MTGRLPGADDGDGGLDELGAVFFHELPNVRMTEVLAVLRVFHPRIEMDGNCPTCDFMRQLGIVSCRNPPAAHRNRGRVGGPHLPVAPVVTGDGAGEHGRIEPVHVVEHLIRAPSEQRRTEGALALRFPLTPGHGVEREAGREEVHHLREQRAAGAGCGLVNQVERRRPANQFADKRQQDERDGMRPIGVAHERKVVQEVLEGFHRH